MAEKKRRLPAEWEPQSAIQLTFPHAESDWAPMLPEVTPCFVQIAAAVARYEKVLIVCKDVAQTRVALSHIQPDRLILVEAPSNDTWARDHGGITVLENDRPLILDFVFNGWGLKFPADLDNLLTRHIYNSGVFHAGIEHGGLVLEGGGIESDGRGTLLTTTSCMLSPNRNPHLSQMEIEKTLCRQFGLQRVLWLENGYLAGDDTDSHIDTLARFCDAETIAYVRCDDPEDEHFEALKEMERELKTFVTLEGKPYRLVPLPWPKACFSADGLRLPATYANFLILNGAVLMPVYGVPQDETALATACSIFPDREITGINCRSLIEQHGSLHCVTMQYPSGVV